MNQHLASASISISILLLSVNNQYNISKHSVNRINR